MSRRVDSKFRARMVELRRNAQLTYKSAQGEAQRNWSVPVVNRSSLLDIPNMHKPAFDRNTINTAYDQIMLGAEEGSAGDIIALRTQLSVIAAEERAFRHRYMSLPRAIANAHGRQYGQGEGDLFSPNGLEGDISNMFKAGALTSTEDHRSWKQVNMPADL